MPPKAIPDRWIPYNACGKVVEGTRFICFKVPLKWSIQDKVPEITKIWDIPTVLAEIPKLGAVIDLTNTARYYNPMDFMKANILHKKILMPGRIIPPESAVIEFTNAVDEFLAKDSDSLIGVHCTHGLNRTGYMVCRYMRDRLGIPAQEAITRFEVARGYKMEREIYIKNILGNDSHSVGDTTKVVPVQNRRNDVTYRSPLGDEYDSPPVDYSKRFGNSNNDRYGYNRYNSSQNSNNRGNNGLFSCYTNRYKDEGTSSGSNRRGDRDRRSNNSPLSWRKREERSGDGSSRRTESSSGYNRNRRDDRSRTRDHN